MALRTAHGRAVEHGLPGPRIEVLPADELPAPVPRDLPLLPAVARPRGKPFAPGNAAARDGGLAKAATKGTVALATVGTGLADNPLFAPYRRKAGALRRAYCAELAELAGGTCGAGPSAMVAAGAAQFAAARFLYDQAAQTLAREDFALAVKVDGAARQHFLAAYELAVRQAQLRGVGADLPDVDEVTRRAEARASERRKPTRIIDSPAG